MASDCNIENMVSLQAHWALDDKEVNGGNCLGREITLALV
jgi:hypothetical protein